MLEKAISGKKTYWWWLALLALFAVVGLFFYSRQLGYGLGITGMSRSVSWGLYIANFTFAVGVAASAVTVVLPYYLHNHKEFRKLTILGEFLAVGAVITALLFVLVDLGQVGRAFNILLHPSPTSLLFWDMVVLSVYLILNLIISWGTLDAYNKNEPPLGWLKLLILISIPWAISIHTVTAFIYSGLGARPFWLTALMAPRFLASAFASGPALLLIICLILKRTAGFDPGETGLKKVLLIITYSLIVNLFFLAIEMFTVFYSGVPEASQHFTYLLFGLNGNHALVPWMWTSISFSLISVALLLSQARRRESVLLVVCTGIFVAMWIDKGLGLIVPGFIPSSTGEVFEYMPTLPEVLITLGVWAVGLAIITVLHKVAVRVFEKANS